MTTRQAIAFVETHGIVLVSGRSDGVPTLVDAIAGERVRGSWWGHPEGKTIFRVLGDVLESGEVLAFRLVDDKITWVHRRLWPALVAIADEIGASRLAAIEQVHTASGAHRTVQTPFPAWVTDEVRAASRTLSRKGARAALADHGLAVVGR